MSEKDFAYWLQGFFEIENPKKLDERQTQMIKDHLKLVFKKETPNRNVMPTIEPTNELYCINDKPHGKNGLIC